jgi:HAD superfamily hydrolase (TIGR01509 family)
MTPKLSHAYRGVIFDLDGTLTDNMPLHADAFGIFAERHGLILSSDLRGRLDGKRNRDIFPILFGRELSEPALKRYSNEKESLYRDLSRGHLAPLPGLLPLLELLAERRLPMAIATSAPGENVPHTLGELRLTERFPVVVRSDQVPQGKPHPDVFVEAARRIGVPAGECLAFEDAPMGVIAACAAGMTCIGITTGFSAAGFAEHDAHPHATVADFEEYVARFGSWLG